MVKSARKSRQNLDENSIQRSLNTNIHISSKCGRKLFLIRYLCWEASLYEKENDFTWIIVRSSVRLSHRIFGNKKTKHVKVIPYRRKMSDYMDSSITVKFLNVLKSNFQELRIFHPDQFQVNFKADQLCSIFQWVFKEFFWNLKNIKNFSVFVKISSLLNIRYSVCFCI